MLSNDTDQLVGEDSIKTIKKTATMPSKVEEAKKPIKKMNTVVQGNKKMGSRGSPAPTFGIGNEHMGRAVTKYNKEWELQDRKEPS